MSTDGDPSARSGLSRDFATSTIWTGDVGSSLPGGGFTVDLSSFVARDDLGLAQALKSGNAGDYTLAADLSFADPPGPRCSAAISRGKTSRPPLVSK